MRGYFDDLAKAAARTLVSAMTADSWDIVKHRFIDIIGVKNESRIDAAQTSLASKGGSTRLQEQLEQEQAWSTRLRDILDDNPSVAEGLRALVEEFGAHSPVAAPEVQHLQAAYGSHVVNAGGAISHNRGDVIAGNKVVRNTNLGLAPFAFIGQLAKSATQRPIVSAVAAIVMLGGVTTAGWSAHWPSAVFGTAGTSPARLAAQKPGTSYTPAPFGDIHSRWQSHVQPWSSVGFTHGLVVVFEPDSPSATSGSLTAYHEDTGTRAWSLNSVNAPGSLDPLVISAGASSRNDCPQSITRVDPASGSVIWTAQVSDRSCGEQGVAADGSYVLVGHTVLNASDGVTLQQIPVGSADQTVGLYGNGILVQDDKTIEFDVLQNGAFQKQWERSKGPTYWAGGGGQYLWLTDTEDPDPSQILNPTTGAVIGSFASRDGYTTPYGITDFSPTGRFQLLSNTGKPVKTGPKVSLYDGQNYTDAISYSGGIFWQYLSPDGLTEEKGVDAIATLPGTFNNIGRLVITASQLSSYDGGGSAQGVDQITSDGRFAVILAQPWIYVYKL